MTLAWLRRSRLVRAVVELRRVGGVEDATRRLLQYVVVPLWVGAGLGDWICHRQTSIETTAGTEESVLHALQMTEAGIPTVLGLFLDVNAGVLAATLAAFGAHQATAVWDVAYADDQRRVSPAEQHIHGLLEQVPAMATAFLFVLHWDQAKALFRIGSERPRFWPERKRRPVSAEYRRGLLATVTALIVLPYGEELWRCVRAQRRIALGADPAREAAAPQT